MVNIKKENYDNDDNNNLVTTSIKENLDEDCNMQKFLIVELGRTLNFKITHASM